MDLEKELEIIKKIVADLEQVPEERRAHVMSFVLNWMKMPGSSPITTQTIGRQIKTSEVSVANLDDPLTLSIKEYMDEKKPGNNYQAIACLAYYLEKNKNIPEFDSKQIEEANAEARRSPFANLSRDLSNAQYLYGFIRSGARDQTKKMLTVDGERIAKSLPDYEAIKQVIKDSRRRINKKYRKPMDDGNSVHNIESEEEINEKDPNKDS